MTAHGGAKHWFTALELAEMALPGLPKTKRKINEAAAERGWAFAVDTAGRPLARPRPGRGGGLEYHHSVLPPATSLALVKRGLLTSVTLAAGTQTNTQTNSRGELWAWLDSQSDAVKAEARARLAVVEATEALESAGFTRTAAIAAASAQHGVTSATVWNWLKLITGVRADDRLPSLAPRRVGGGAHAEIHPDAWTAFKSDYLRPEQPTLASCYARLQLAAAAQGWGELPHVKSLQRKLDRELDGRTIMLAREGVDALRRSLPPQIRSVDHLHALQHVNIDGHRWDVFVRWPDGRGGYRVVRPMMVAIQDLYSRKMVAWRIGETESADSVRLCFADLFETYGIPEACTLDNGRGFASKWITGGTPNRYRFKVQPSDPTGLLTQLGVKIHWTLPYRGQSKPIERAFRDLCDHGAKHPAFAGAYTGNKPDAKPENYGSRAVDLEVFRRVVDQVIKAHNEREGRRTQTAHGVKSFDQVFNDSYVVSPIRKALPEQLRMALLAADKVSTDRKSGAITLFDNTYWASELGEHAGAKVVARFDPDNLTREVHVYDLAGRFITTAPLWGRTGFTDAAAAKERAKLEGTVRKTARAALAAEQLLTANELAALLPDDPTEAQPYQANVIRPVRLGGATAAALKPVPAPDQAPNFMDRFVAAERRLRAVE